MDRQRISSVLQQTLVCGLLAAAVALTALLLPGVAAGQPNRAVTSDSGWFVDMNRFSAAAHSGFKCEDCHGTMIESGRAHPDPEDPGFLKTPAISSYDYGRCQKCHQVSYDRYMVGGHARARSDEADGTQRAPAVWPPALYAAPTCGACHSSHYDPSGLSRVESGRRMIVVCSQCHPAHGASYRDNIHGRLAADLKTASAAYCTDCHGAHTTASLRDPETALAACRRCHSDAGPEYANIVIHASADHLKPEDNDKNTAIRWIERVRLAAVIVVALSLVFFFGHSILWILRELHEKLRKH